MNDLDLIKKGVQAVKTWREQNPTGILGLSSCDLRDLDLNGYDLRGAVLYKADLRRTSLRNADLSWVPLPEDDDAIHTNLVEANLEGVQAQNACFYSARMNRANLTKANLYSANLTSTDLRDSKMIKANLQAANFGYAKLENADMQGALLGGARFQQCDLSGVNFAGCSMSGNYFVGCRISGACGLETVSHHFPLILDISTLLQLEEPIPREFLTKGGVLPQIIEAFEQIISSQKEHTVFISYTHQDEQHREWVEALALALQGNGIYVFLDQWDICPGDSLSKFIDHGISTATHALFICTRRSVVRADAETNWTGYEARQLKALGIEGEIKTIAVLREGEKVPQYLRGTMWVDCRDDSGFESSVRQLVKAIKGSGSRPIPNV